MGHKVLRDHANVFCQMFVGWRMGDDLGVLSSLLDGQLVINALTGVCHHSMAGIIDLHICGEITEWFRDQLISHHIERESIESAVLLVNLRKLRPIPGRKNGVRFEWKCESEIRTNDRAYNGHLTETSDWL